MTSTVNLVAVRHAVAPADKQHRFGHGKAQALGALIQSFIIALSGLFLLKESVVRFFNPKPLHEIGWGIAVMILAIIVTAFLLSFQRFVIKKTNSLSIKADMAHYTGDILMNVGVVVSMLITTFFDCLWIDAAFGIGVSFYLFYAAYGVIKEAVSMLMDTELPACVECFIRKTVFSFPEIKSMSDLKTRSSGEYMFIQFSIQLPPETTLKSAHDLTELIEILLKKEYAQAQIIIHTEPFLEKDNDSTI